jgi:hypothetical protein
MERHQSMEMLRFPSPKGNGSISKNRATISSSARKDAIHNIGFATRAGDGVDPFKRYEYCLSEFS